MRGSPWAFVELDLHLRSQRAKEPSLEPETKRSNMNYRHFTY